MNPTDPLVQALLARQGGAPQGPPVTPQLPAQPSDGFWAHVGPPPQQAGPPPGPPGPASLPPSPGVSPGRPGQPPSGTPHLAASGPQGQPNSALLQSLLHRKP